MPHRIDRSVARPDSDGGDIHTAAVFLLAFLLMGVVAAILLTGQGLKLPDIPLSQNRIMANLLGSSKAPAAKATESPAPVVAPVAEVVAEPQPEQKPQPKATTSARNTVRVANTGGTGVYVRRTPDMADRLVAWPDNTVLEIVGEDRTVGGQQWRNIKDPAGNVGWVPGEFISQ